MRKLIESTLVAVDGVNEAPERWASFDAEATALSLEQLGNYDAFVMGRGIRQPGVSPRAGKATRSEGAVPSRAAAASR
jgi:hypothetical protein